MNNILDELFRYYDSEDYLYEMASLGGEDTGLPMSLFFSPQPANHKIRPIRFKVSDNPKKFMPTNSLVYSIVEDENGIPINIEPLINKRLSSKDEKILSMYILLYYEPIKLYWESKIMTKPFVNAMGKI